MLPQPPENDETLEALARRLRNLPPPPVPAGLEGRLLAAIPSRRKRRRAGRFWLGAAVLVGAAAAVLFAVRLPSGGEPPAVRVVVVPPVRPAPTVWTYEQALRHSDDASVVLDQVAPPFAWPVAGPRMVFLSDRNAGPPD